MGIEPDVHARILVVDDQPTNVELIVRLLVRAGYRSVDGTTDPHVALARARADDLDLLLIDLHMPEVDGFRILENVRDREDASFLPVIVLSGDVDVEARRRALRLGATDFLTKPFDVDEVVLRCRNLLELRRLHRELEARNLDLQDQVVDRTRALEEARQQRRAIAEAFGRLHEPASMDEAAAAICTEVIRVVGLEGAALVGFRRSGAATLLAAAGDIGDAVVLARALPPAETARLRDRAAAGPWIDERPAPLSPRSPEIAWPRREIHAPLRSGGEVVGLLVVGSPDGVPVESLAERIPPVLEFAAVAGAILGPELLRRDVPGLRDQIAGILEANDLDTVFQPVVRLETGRVIGYEALTRFADGVAPDRRIADATAVGLGPDLELACIRAAVARAGSLPSDAWLSVNVSPDVVLDVDGLGGLIGRPARPLVLELTEHVGVADYAALRLATDELRSVAKIAIDDAGAGYSSLRHVVELRPDYVKLDIGLVRSIERDPARQALVAGMDYFARKTGCSLIAEGIETEEERTLLRSLDVELGQGFLLGRPAPAA